ncbi:DNA adenine methylase [Anaerolineales bacterium]
MQPRQLSLFSSDRTREYNYPFPATRYQGSKRKLADWIWESVYQLEFSTVLDVFGGTGVVSHMFKNAGKQVTYNDFLAFNYEIGLALIKNQQQTLSAEEIDLILSFPPDILYPNFIQENFQGIYFTDEENIWLDQVVYNIEHLIQNQYKRAIARFALFQACIIKRPYNLFHRANLYMRTAKVERSFGNKTTWDTPFETHFRNFIAEANQAIFDNGRKNEVIQGDALQTPKGLDLVYIDPPYLNKKGIGVDYRGFYHFLEGLVHYEDWANLIDYESKHRRLQPEKSPWNDASQIADEFERLIAYHRDSILIISYRDDGIPSKAQLMDIVLKYKKQVQEASQPIQYALSNKKSHELLLIAP